MDAVLPLVAKVEQLLTLAKSVGEECYRMTVAGEGVSEDIAQLCIEIEEQCTELSIPCPTFRVNDYTLTDADELNDYINNDSCFWVMILSKDSIVKELTKEIDFAKSKDNLFYFSEEAALKWASKIDPFAVIESELMPSFDNDIIIWLTNTDLVLGGGKISILPIGSRDFPPECAPKDIYPERVEINEIVRINSNEMIKIRPDSFVISWGDHSSKLAQSIMLLAIKSLVACICFELKKNKDDYFVTFKGTKSITGSLEDPCAVDLFALQNQLVKTVRWIYSERKETRQQLVMDRLSLDMTASENFYSELSCYITDALKHSQDSYGFVILDRKDAYHKEMRELLKDMRSQADMYASKVRDVVNNITRDMLGVFAFVGYSFLGKFDKANLTELLNSHELSLLVKFLAGYLLLSCVMQLIVHLRDASLTSVESEKWLRVLQRYTSREENTESFLEPIKKRKRTLFWALGIMSCIYLLLALSIYKLPTIVLCLLTTG